MVKIKNIWAEPNYGGGGGYNPNVAFQSHSLEIEPWINDQRLRLFDEITLTDERYEELKDYLQPYANNYIISIKIEKPILKEITIEQEIIEEEKNIEKEMIEEDFNKELMENTNLKKIKDKVKAKKIN